MKRVHTATPRPSLSGLSLGGHRNLTILIVSLLLLIAGCVYFVNAVVLTDGTDEVYRQKVEAAANPITFNKSLLKQALTFSQNTTNTTVPSGRVNPFGQ